MRQPEILVRDFGNVLRRTFFYSPQAAMSASITPAVANRQSVVADAA